jgi:superfamily II DNA or RNA helicase
MTLRDYQQIGVDALRVAIRRHRAVCFMLPTGGGKTQIFSAITAGAFSKKRRVWIVVPRNEVLDQSSEKLSELNVPHGKIAAGKNESRAYRVHVVSKDTLTRRWDKIKNWPDLIIIDECHLNLDFQVRLARMAPESTRFIGFTATPERLDGRGLSRLPEAESDEAARDEYLHGLFDQPERTEYADDRGIYDELVQGSTIRELVERHYLSDLRYFCPPIPGIIDLHRRGTEVDADELEALLTKRNIYGKVIDHYRDICADRPRPALVFCRTVKAAYDTAQRFRDAGFRFECVEGNMAKGKREAILGGLKNGTLDGVTNCEIATYGLDIPRIEVLIMLRYTESRALFGQMIGRGLRPFDGKEYCYVLDHVGLLRTHQHPFADYDWSFYGTEKQRAKPGESVDTLQLCPKCFLYFTGSKCPNCGGETVKKLRPEVQEVDGRLVEVGALALNERPPEQRKEYQDRIAAALEACSVSIDAGAVGELLKIADELGRSPMWVYWELSKGKRAVNFPLLYEIARQKEYKKGWIWFKQKEIEGRLRSVV